MSREELPVGWEATPMSTICDKITDGTHQSPNFEADGIPFLVISNIIRGKIEWNAVKKWISHDTYAALTARVRPERGDVLYSAVGSYGTAVVVDVDRPFAFQRHIAHIKPNCRVVDPEFLSRWLNSPEAREKADSVARGVAQKTVTLGNLAEFEVPLAPLPEQHRIVEKIKALTVRSRRARDVLDTLPTLIDRYRQSILVAAFRGDLTAEWRKKQNGLQPISDAELSGLRRQLWDAVQERVNVSRKSRYQSAEDIAQEGAELPEGWRWVTVDELCPIVQYGTSAKTTEQDGVVVLRMGNIQSGTIVFDSIKSLPEEHEEFPALLLDKGDLLFNRTNSPELVGKSAVFDGYSTPCSFASYLIRLKVAGLNPRLLAAYINSPFGRMWARGAVSQQVGQANINGSKLKALAVPLPPVEEQEQILRKLKAHDEAIARVIDQHRIGATRLATLDQSILAKAFRGELVPQDPNDEPASVLLERIRAERAAAGPAPRRGRRPKAAGDS